MFVGLRDHLRSMSERKIISGEIALIVISLTLLYPLLSVDSELIAVFVAISLASVLIPINTYVYLRGFHRTAVTSLIFAHVVPWFTFFLIVFSPGTNSIGWVALFFVIFFGSIALGYLLPLIVISVYVLKTWRDKND